MFRMKLEGISQISPQKQYQMAMGERDNKKPMTVLKGGAIQFS